MVQAAKPNQGVFMQGFPKKDPFLGFKQAANLWENVEGFPILS